MAAKRPWLIPTLVATPVTLVAAVWLFAPRVLDIFGAPEPPPGPTFVPMAVPEEPPTDEPFPADLDVHRLGDRGCGGCHATGQEGEGALRGATVLIVCSRCHPEDHPQTSHPVGVRVGQETTLPLDPNRILSCHSCHDSHSTDPIMLRIKPLSRLCEDCHPGY